MLSCHHGSEFAYSPFEMTSTLAMDNDLVCKDFYWTIIIDEFFMVSESNGNIYLTYIHNMTILYFVGGIDGRELSVWRHG